MPQGVGLRSLLAYSVVEHAIDSELARCWEGVH